MTQHAHVIIAGDVQGVGFRVSTYSKIRDLGMKGTVRNRTDGKVEAEFYGDQEKLNDMISWCHMGPPAARVTHVEVTMKE